MNNTTLDYTLRILLYFNCECYEEKVQPHRKTDYTPIIYNIRGMTYLIMDTIKRANENYREKLCTFAKSMRTIFPLKINRKLT